MQDTKPAKTTYTGGFLLTTPVHASPPGQKIRVEADLVVRATGGKPVFGPVDLEAGEVTTKHSWLLLSMVDCNEASACKTPPTPRFAQQETRRKWGLPRYGQA